MNHGGDPSRVSPLHREWCFEVASTVEAKMAGYRVRYEGLTAQLGDERYADHANRTYIDPWDDEHALLILARHAGGMVAGTTRYQRRAARPFPADELYDFRGYANLIGCPVSEVHSRVALLDRSAVLPEQQRTGLYANMQLVAECLSKASGIALHAGLVSHGNLRMLKVLEATGWERSGREVLYNQWSGFELYKIL